MSRVSTLLRVALAVVLLWALVVAAAWLLQRRLIYFPDRSTPPAAARVIPGARDVTLRTTDGLRLTAWLVEPPPGTAGRRLAVLLAPGNAGNRLARVPLATALAGRGLTVLLVDYRGYGGNPGSPSEEGLARDIEAARTYLVEQAGIPVERLLYYGESLGAAVVTALAAKHPPAGLILRSPFTDLPAAGRRHYPFLPVRLLARDRFPVAEEIARVAAPTLIVYGTADSIVPPQQSLEVAGRAAGPVRVVAVHGADHNDASLLNGAQLIDAIAELAGPLSG
ncbi:alpha/beta fold hydrolase [Actinoplanes sp. KI2]|uniref:alpha/beta hydrolase n=1 Tax=Actinoplanes sp. KI2 TaxID=2983315 RepID=UPI0021D61231|nr:alpha/beta fold hydrolase [Actinoplanes sp. KI2]MCU7728426.1 alpha/beta fold hydrolase [Actinoplanes sp. KI2]